MKSGDIADWVPALVTEEQFPRITSREVEGAEIKLEPEDFLVEEELAFQPSGAGDFLYLRIQKRDMDHQTLLQRIGKCLGISTREIGTAGMKDKRAVTRQTISVPASCAERLDALEGIPSIQLLSISRHEHALRTGKVRRNHFVVRVHPEKPVEQSWLLENIQRIQEDGIPNFFGSQRFGRRGKNAWRSLRWLLPNSFPSESPGAPKGKLQKKLMYSVLQSLLFNACLVRRMETGTHRTILPGDVLMKTDSGGLFLSEAPEEEATRLAEQKIAITGPLPGRKDRWKNGPSRALEKEVLNRFGVSEMTFEDSGKLALGTRRPLTVHPSDLRVELEGPGILFRFSLPSGSYATVLIQQFFRTNS